jgi:hypothetical protein
MYDLLSLERPLRRRSWSGTGDEEVAAADFLDFADGLDLEDDDFFVDGLDAFRSFGCEDLLDLTFLAGFCWSVRSSCLRF